MTKIHYFIYINLLFQGLCCKELWVTHKAYLDISIDKEAIGTIEIGLFGEVVPKTVKNFVELCNAEVSFSYDLKIKKVLPFIIFCLFPFLIYN